MKHSEIVQLYMYIVDDCKWKCKKTAHSALNMTLTIIPETLKTRKLYLGLKRVGPHVLKGDVAPNMAFVYLTQPQLLL